MSRSRLNLARQANRAQLKARVAIDGPTGSGKTWTALEWAFVLGDDEPVLVIDTERGSAEWYSDQFPAYHTLTWTPPYAPGELAETIRDAGERYGVIIVDSLSHFWEGEGGTQDIADAAARRDSGGNRFAGWKVATPALRHLVDSMLGVDAHLIATMRSKMEYVLQEDERTGKKKPVKLGMAPIMRQGVEYEFTLIADMDLEHRLVVTKSRCSAVADQVADPHRAGEVARTFRAWLDAGEKPIGEADAQRLAAALNEAGQEARAAWLARFNVRPTQLPESRLEEAEAFVASLDTPAPDPEPEQPEPTPEPDPEPEPQAKDLDRIRKDIAKKARHVFRHAYDAAPARSKTKAVDRLRHALTYAVTQNSGDPRSSLNDLTADELSKVSARLEDINAGHLTYNADPLDDAAGVTFTSPSGKQTTVLWAEAEMAHNEGEAA